MNELIIHKGGVCATIQDLGRWGCRSIGVCVGGVMDRTAARVANLLVGNREEQSVLEIAMNGTEIGCTHDALVAVCGADLRATAGPQFMPLERPVRLQAGTDICFRAAAQGNFAYLAIAGGLDVPVVLGGRGTHLQSGFGGFRGRAVRANDRIPIGPEGDRNRAIRSAVAQSGSADRIAFPRWGYAPPRDGDRESPTAIRVLPAAHTDQLTESSQRALWSSSFRLSVDCDRMGFRLEGSPLEFQSDFQIASMPTIAGTIQLPVGGSPIVLMADAAPTGGYPQIGHVISADLPRLAQTKIGRSIQFVPATLDEAYRAAQTAESELRRLRRAIHWHLNF